MQSIMLIFYIYSFLIGIVIASFLNVVIDRVPRGESIVKGRSHCSTCNHTLAWYDLFPILSYLILKGKCRYCKANIPVRDTIIEFMGGLVGIYCFYKFQFQWDTVIVFSIIMILLTITMIDYDTMTIPNGLILALFIPTIIMMCLHPEVTLIQRFIGMICISIPMYVLILIIPDCFGGGDVKLIAVGGLLLGWESAVLAAFIAIFLGGIYGCYLLITKKLQKGTHIAFGPYLSLGIVVSLVYGSSIIQAYLALFQIG